MSWFLSFIIIIYVNPSRTLKIFKSSVDLIGHYVIVLTIVSMLAEAL